MKFVANAARPLRHGVFLRGDAGHGLEHPVKMERAEPRRLRQLGKGRRFIGSLDGAAGFCNRGGVKLFAALLVGLAALARTKACGLGGLKAGMKPHVLGVCQA